MQSDKALHATGPSDSSQGRGSENAFAHGGPLGAGRIRSCPEDFIVREWLGFEPSGEGEHMLLTVRKRGANTKWVAKQLADHAGARVREVGYAGLKDRHALTEQAFTVPARKTTPEFWLNLGGEGYEVIAAAPHRRKLPRGAHKGNDFEIIVRDLNIDANVLDARLRRIAKEGAPNYFGEQRFGREGGNLAAAERWLLDGAAPADRDERSFALSAARSAVFNAVLSARVADNTWNTLLPGEVVNLDGTGSIFGCEIVDAELAARCAQLDVHPTGPLCGVGESRVTLQAREIEEHALQTWRAWREALIGLGVMQQRRALRLAVRDLSWDYAGGALTLRFRLMRGAFATTVLREIANTQQPASDAGEPSD